MLLFPRTRRTESPPPTNIKMNVTGSARIPFLIANAKADSLPTVWAKSAFAKANLINSKSQTGRTVKERYFQRLYGVKQPLIKKPSVSQINSEHS